MTAEPPPRGAGRGISTTQLLDDLISENQDASIPEQLTRDTKLALIRAVDELPDRQRTVISLYYFERLTLKQIKSVYNISESRVSRIHAEAVLNLRTKLASLLHALSGATAPDRPTDADEALQEVVERFHVISPALEAQAVRNGLPASTWNALELLGFARYEIAGVVGTSEKTIHRKVATLELYWRTGRVRILDAVVVCPGISGSPRPGSVAERSRLRTDHVRGDSRREN